MDIPIVLIHGTNAGPWTMANFSGFFKANGLNCYCPTYRFHSNYNSTDTDSKLAKAGISDYIEDIAKFVKTLDKPPILIGHSLGGVIAQKLAAKGLAQAIILLNGSVNWGIPPTTPEECTLGKNFMSTGPFWENVILPDFETMAIYGLNKLSEADQQQVYERLIPESGRVLFELFFWVYDENRTTKIDYDSITCPVLMISGSDDLAIPPSTARLIANRYNSNLTFHEAEGFGHYLMLEPDWENIAQLCLNWIFEQATNIN